jgi:hypothetical protein
MVANTGIGNMAEKREAADDVALGIHYGYLYGWAYSLMNPEGEIGITHKLHVWPLPCEVLVSAYKVGWRRAP